MDPSPVVIGACWDLLGTCANHKAVLISVFTLEKANHIGVQSLPSTGIHGYGPTQPVIYRQDKRSQSSSITKETK